MSIAEAQRFADALAEDEELRASVKPLVSGLASFVEAAKQHGYDFTIDEAKRLVRNTASVQQLSDTDLEAIGGGTTTKTTNVSVSVNFNTGATATDVVAVAILF